MNILSLSWWKQRQIQIAVNGIILFAIVGLIPVDVVILYLAPRLVEHQKLTFLAIVIYLILYFLGSLFLLRIILLKSAAQSQLKEKRRRYEEKLKKLRWRWLGRIIIKFTNFMIKTLSHKPAEDCRGLKPLAHESKRHLKLLIFGLIPLGAKFGTCHCVFYPQPTAIIAVLLGEILKSYIIVYYPTLF